MAARGQDYFTLELVTPQGVRLPSIEYEQQMWFVGEPGQEFAATVDVINNSYKTYRMTLLVDGQDVGYSLIGFGHQRHSQHKFRGWLQHSGTFTGASATTYSLFKFGSCKPSHAAATVGSADEIAAGKVELQIQEVIDTGAKQERLTVHASGPKAAADKKLPEGKKWFLAPGLKAEAGSVTSHQTNWSRTVYRTVATLESVKVRFDCSESLLLRKALNPRFAPHRAILRMSANPSVRAAGAEPATTNNAAADEASSRAAAAAAGGTRVKREAGARVKRERQDGDEEDEEPIPRSATAADRVDLTEEPMRPMTINGRRLAADELAVCDLCDSDDEGAAPKWQVQKKQQVAVDL